MFFVFYRSVAVVVEFVAEVEKVVVGLERPLSPEESSALGVSSAQGVALVVLWASAVVEAGLVVALVVR